MKRRDFLQVLAAGGGLTLCSNPSALWAAPVSSFESACHEAGFDPRKKGNSFFVIGADIHYSLDIPKQPEAFRTLLRECSGMDPRPEFVGVLGDLICSRSLGFGNNGNEKAASEELALLKSDLDSLAAGLSMKLIPGNHDTQPREEDSKFCCEKLGIEPYHAFQACGAYFLFLNGGHDASLSRNQAEWMKAEIARIPNDATLILAVHQPLGVSNERGFAMAFPELLANRTGETILLAGHEHHDQENVFRLPKTFLHEFVHVSCAGGWKREGCAYWIYCLSAGKLTARIRRNPDGTFSALPAFNRLPNEMTGSIPQPFEAFSEDDLLACSFMGFDGMNVHSLTGADCGSYVFYLKEITVSLTPASVPPEARRIAILGRLASSFNGKVPEDTARHVFVSDRGQRKTEIRFLEKLPGDLFIYEIPDEFRSCESIQVHIESFGFKANDVFAGLAFVR